jgi:hypothetical protein
MVVQKIDGGLNVPLTQLYWQELNLWLSACEGLDETIALYQIGK